MALLPNFDNLPNQPASTSIGREQKSVQQPSSNISVDKSGNGFHKYNSEYVIKDYFKDNDTFNFKYGLEFGLNSNLGGKSTGNSLMNLDEDPTILGFDVVILDKAPLFNDIDSFFDYAEDNNINQVVNKREIYDDFIKQFAKFFNVDDRTRGEFKVDNRFNSFKTHYLNNIEGLNTLVHHTGIGNSKGRQMTDFGTDKLTFSLSEDIGLNSGYLAATYRNLIYSKKDGRQIIPENLMRFDMVVILSEIRNFNRVSNAAANAKKNQESEAIKVFNDNINRYIYTLYDCQLDFNTYSFEDTMNQGGFGSSAPETSTGIKFDIYYKYVGFEMEKFNFNPGTVDPDKLLKDGAKYINNQRNVPTTYQMNSDKDSDIAKTTNASNEDKFPKRTYDLRYQMNDLNNSTEGKEYLFDFPMINSKYSRDLLDQRSSNEKSNNEQTPLKTGVNKIIDKSNQELQRKFSVGRSRLISGLAAKVRETTGLRNISSPTNVYAGTGLGQFVLDKVGDFANLGLSTALDKGTSYLDKLSRGAENSLFGSMDDKANKLKGYDPPKSSENKYSGDNNIIPNVYRK